MALLNLNGVDVQCTASDRQPVRLGEMVRSLNGAPRSTASVNKVELRYTSSYLSVPDAKALRGLVDGDGHALSFSDGTLYTSRELPPDAVAGSYALVSGGYHSSVALRLSYTATVTWAVGASEGTILLWVRDWIGSSTWTHVTVRYSAASPGVPLGWWLNGVPSGPPNPDRCASLDATGRLVLGSPTATIGSQIYVSDVVFLPYWVPDSWAAGLYAFHQARAWPRLPNLLAKDPRLPSAGLVVRGESGSGRAVPLLGNVGEVFDFTLHGT